MSVDPYNLAGLVVLLSDTLRVDAYAEAIRRRVEPGQVVLDLGSGTGVMARFAALAGASRVIAIEGNPEFCELNEHANQLLGLDRVIEVVHARVEEVRLEEPVDVVISELIGDLLDDEDMSRILSAFCAANSSCLGPGVRWIPEETLLFGQLVEIGEVESAVGEAQAEAADAYHRARSGEVRVLIHLEGLPTLGEPFELLRVDAVGGRIGGDGEPVSGFPAAKLPAGRRAMLCWFETRLAEGVYLDSRGNSRVRTSWGLPLVPLRSDPGVEGLSSADLELRFRLDRAESGDLEVDAGLSRGAGQPRQGG